jgi:Mg-chelatase subunit ChlD
MIYAIDGSNVLLGLRLNKKPSHRLFARLLLALRERGTDFQLFFDNSIENLMAQERLTTEWNEFKGALTAAGITPTFHVRADSPIQAFCRAHDAWLINSSDKLDSWNTRPSRIHRARARRNRNTLELKLMDDMTAKAVFRESAHEPFNFGGIKFPALNMQNTIIEPLIAPDTQYSSAAAEGTLLVLALDASGSMSQTNSFDGRPKSEHLNEIVKSAITRLRNSRIGEGLYVAILRFEDDVTPLICSTGAVFSSINDWFATLRTFNYLQGVILGQTNIRLALQRSKEMIQNTIADSDSVYALADNWRAAVVLITDGNHYVRRGDGTYETDANVALQALDIHEGLSGLIGERIDVGCVGIGTDVNRNLLVNIASPCTATQRGMAARAGIGGLLLDDRLCIIVDSQNDKFGEAVRTFIDVASGSA